MPNTLQFSFSLSLSLSLSGKPGGYDRVRNAEIGNKVCTLSGGGGGGGSEQLLLLIGLIFSLFLSRSLLSRSPLSLLGL